MNGNKLQCPDNVKDALNDSVEASAMRFENSGRGVTMYHDDFDYFDDIYEMKNPSSILPKDYRITYGADFTSWREESDPKLWFPDKKPVRNPPSPNRSQFKLEKARKRSISTLGSIFARLEEEPKGFMRLGFDRNVKDEWAIDDVWECFKQFRRHLEYNYPNCWFIFIMEYSPYSKYHFHLSGRLGQAVPFKKLRSKWMSITGSKSHGCIHFKKYDPLHFPYVTKRKEKAARTRQLMEELGPRKSFWGCIHRKLIPLAPLQDQVINEDQKDRFSVHMRDQLIEQGAAESSIRRVMTPANRLNYGTREMREKALEYAMRPIEDDPTPDSYARRGKVVERMVARLRARKGKPPG